MTGIKVKFTKDYKVNDADGAEFKEDKEYTLSESSAAHFILRGAAVKVDIKAEKEAKAAEAKEAKAKAAEAKEAKAAEAKAAGK